MLLKLFPLIGSAALPCASETNVCLPKIYSVHILCSYRYKHLQRKKQAGVE